MSFPPKAPLTARLAQKLHISSRRHEISRYNALLQCWFLPDLLRTVPGVFLLRTIRGVVSVQPRFMQEVPEGIVLQTGTSAMPYIVYAGS